MHLQFELSLTVVSADGEKIQQVEAEISFENLSNVITKEVENWQENYTLTEEMTKQEISTTEEFTNMIETSKKEKKMNVMVILKPKYKFSVCDETDSKENTFSFMYFGESITTFKNVCQIISDNCPNMNDSDPKDGIWQDKYDLIHEDTNGNKSSIKDEPLFNAMIREMKVTRKSDIFLRFKTKVWCF